MNIPSSSDIKTVTNYFIWFFQKHGDLITNLKLQKLLYFAQGWFLALYDTPLFKEEIQAWIHGPVVATVYHSYKGFGYGPITAAMEEPKFLTSKPVLYTTTPFLN